MTTKSREREGDEDGEYVVRFFNDRSSIGAIGHSTSAGALVEAADYLLERGLAGVEVPWSPDEGERTVLNVDPTRADGSPMDDPERLANGLVLETAGNVDEACRPRRGAGRSSGTASDAHRGLGDGVRKVSDQYSRFASIIVTTTRPEPPSNSHVRGAVSPQPPLSSVEFQASSYAGVDYCYRNVVLTGVDFATSIFDGHRESETTAALYRSIVRRNRYKRDDSDVVATPKLRAFEDGAPRFRLVPRTRPPPSYAIRFPFVVYENSPRSAVVPSP